MKTLAQIQAEVGRWAREQFKANPSHDESSVLHTVKLGSLPPLLGMVEELGELARVVGRRHQGRSEHNVDAAQTAKEDALADLLIFMCDYATREGIDLETVLNTTWEKVQKRRATTWAADKEKEATPIQVCGGVQDARSSDVIGTHFSKAFKKPPLGEGHDWYKPEGRLNSRCRNCGAYSHLSSGFLHCSVKNTASPLIKCKHCGGTGKVMCEWSNVPTSCPICHRDGETED